MLSLSISLSIYLSIYLSLSLYIYIYTSLYIYIYTYIHIYTSLSLSIYIYIHTYMYISIYLPIYRSIYIYIYTDVFIYLYISTCMYIYIYIYIYIGRREREGSAPGSSGARLGLRGGRAFFGLAGACLRHFRCLVAVPTSTRESVHPSIVFYSAALLGGSCPCPALLYAALRRHPLQHPALPCLCLGPAGSFCFHCSLTEVSSLDGGPPAKMARFG